MGHDPKRPTPEEPLVPVEVFGLPAEDLEEIRQSRRNHYTNTRLWMRTLVRLHKIPTKVAAAHIAEATEAEFENDPEFIGEDGQRQKRFYAQTVERAIAHESRNSLLDIEGNPFDPGEVHWNQTLLERGIDPNDFPRVD